MRRHRFALFCLPVLAGAALAAGQSFEFMPDGGRGLFALVYPDEASAWATLTTTATQEGWLAMLEHDAPTLTPQEARTLSGYLAANAPLDIMTHGAEAEIVLPPDGKDLALAHCQSCHSLFTGYLMQRRDETAWRAVFVSPFHRAIAITPAEITTFADYSVVNMPLRVEVVPPELRF